MAREQEELRQAVTTLDGWSGRSYLRLAALRRLYFRSLESFDDYDSKICTRLEYLDHVLDVLQHGNAEDKLMVLRAARAGDMKFIGEVIL
jgi:hypothetical protein